MKHVVTTVLLSVIALVLSLGAFRFLTSCDDDPICEAAVGTEEMLQQFGENRDSQKVYTYFNEYIGEAPGSQTRITFLKWGNDNIEEMNQLLNTWPDDQSLKIDKAAMLALLKFHAQDSNTDIKFELSEA